MTGGQTFENADQPPGSTVNAIWGDVYGSVVQARDIGQLHLHLDVRKAQPVPRYLPQAPARLVNRVEEIEHLDDTLARAAASSGPVVAVLSGMHGVGKSAVGRHWANRVRHSFVDGDLFRDFSTHHGQGPVAVDEVLGDFLSRLGTADIAIPATLAERTAMFRTMTASKRLLIMLDDVDFPAQVIPLIPTGPGSVVIVTSNSDLQELQVSESAELIPVRQFDEAASRELIAEMAGRARLHAEPEATSELLDICGGLPLALAICGARLASRSNEQVGDLVHRLADERTRLDGLSVRSGPSVRAVFDLAYTELDVEQQLVYRRLALHPGPDFTTSVAAVLTDLPLPTADEILDDLADAHLVEVHSRHRFQLHDLIRLHATRCSMNDDQPEIADAAVRRLVDWYHAALCAADRAVTPDRLRLAGESPTTGLPIPTFDAAQAAFTWFENERSNVVAIVRTAHERELHASVWRMVEALWPLFFNHKHYSEWIQTHRCAADSAERCHDPAAEARIRTQLARAYIELREFPAAHDELRLAEIKVDLSGHRKLQGSVREFVGICYLHEGDFEQALVALRESRSMFSAIDEVRGVAIQDYHIGWALALSGHPKEALRPLQQALVSLKKLGDDVTAARALLRLGEAARMVGDTYRARQALTESLAITTALDIRLEEAQAYEELAAVEDAEHQRTEANANRHRAYDIYRIMGHPRALELASQLGDPT